jgi:hypothetical protein
MCLPKYGITENKFVITVTPHKLICPNTKLYPMKAVAIITKNNAIPMNHPSFFFPK